MKPHRRRQYGRQIAPSRPNMATDVPFQPRHVAQWPGLPENLRAMKMKSFNDPKIPPGHKFSHMQKIPLEHKSSKEMQDEVERVMLRNIRNATRGPNRDYLIEKYEFWLANGKPTMSPQHGSAVDKHDQRLTQGKGSGIWQDAIENERPKQRRRVAVSDLVER